jgi:hypothetical protein
MVSTLLLVLACSDGELPPPRDDTGDTQDTDPPGLGLTEREGTMVTSRVLTAGFESAVSLVLSCVGAADSPVPEEHAWTSSDARATHEWTFRGLLADTTYTCSASPLTGSLDPELEPVTFTTGPLPDGLQTHVLTLDTWEPGAETGWTLIDPFTFVDPDSPEMDDAWLVVVDMAGQVRWYWEVPEGDGVVAFDWHADGNAFWTGGGLTAVVPPRILDLDGVVLAETSIDANHDAHWFGDSSYGLVQGPTGFCIEERLWADDSEQFRICADQLGYAGELQGANSFDVVDEPGGVMFYVSLTDAGRILKISRDTQEVVWTFGDEGDFTGLSGPFSWVHDVRAVDCEHDVCLSYYDNGSEPTGSQAIVYGVDEDTMVATEIRSWRESGWYEKTIGGFQVLDGGAWLIGRGHNEGTNPESPATTVVEVDADDTIVWQLSLTPSEHATYRARRVGPCAFFSHSGYCAALRP